MFSDNRLHRRQLLRSGSAAGVSAWLGNLVSLSGASENKSHGARRFRRCVTLWMQGGPSQLDTFDPKPGAETGGPFKSVATSVPGMQFCETLSGLSRYANELCVLRSVGSTQGEHERASHLLHTGFERIDSFPRPSLGAHVAHNHPKTDVPGFVTLGSQSYGPAFLGTQNGPFVINDLRQTAQTIERVRRQRDRLDLIGELNRKQATRNSDPSLRERAMQVDALRRLVDSPFAGSINIDQESSETIDRYGDSDFGRNVLVARRMLESGVKYVEVQMPGWDTHVGNFPSVKRLCKQLEPAWIALMDDLKSNGLWNDTLILWMGEFGRTPSINGQSGRDHFPNAIPVVLGGGSIGGRVIGDSGIDGRRSIDQTSSVADLMYSLMSLMGIDADQELTTAFGSPTTATDDGQMIDGLI